MGNAEVGDGSEQAVDLLGLEGIREDGDPVPEPGTNVFFAEVA